VSNANTKQSRSAQFYNFHTKKHTTRSLTFFSSSQRINMALQQRVRDMTFAQAATAASRGLSIAGMAIPGPTSGLPRSAASSLADGSGGDTPTLT
jgi:hypothetical protein